MSVWQNIKSLIQFGVKNQSYTGSYSSSSSEIFGLNNGVNGLPHINEKTALQVSAIWACVSLISGAIARLPVEVYGREDGQINKVDNHSVEDILNNEWCARWSSNSAWEYLGLSRLFYGDAYVEIKRKGPEVVGLVPHHPLRVQVAPWVDGSRLTYIIYPDPSLPKGVTRILDQDDVIHVTGLGFDGCYSYSPLRHALKMTGAVALATQDHAAQFFANQARPDYAIVMDKDVKPTAEQIDSLKSQIDEQHNRQFGNSHRPMVLTGGSKIAAISLPNEDAELLATREFQIDEIARIYGVPPFMIGHTKNSSNWGTGIAEQGLGFVRYVLAPHLEAISNEMNRKLFPDRKNLIKFDTMALEEADFKSMVDAFRGAVGRAGEDAIMTVEEVRRKLNLPAVPKYGHLRKGDDNEPQ